MAEPTILVKKKDGTQVRMTMSEFRIYQNTLKSDQNIPTTKNTKVLNENDEKIEIEKDEETEKLKNLKTEGTGTSPLIGGTPVDRSQQDGGVVAEVQTPPSLFAPAHKVSSPIRPELMAKANRGGVDNLPANIQTEALSTTAPVSNIFVDEAIATLAPKHLSTLAPEHNEQFNNLTIKPLNNVEPFDHRSLLEHEAEEKSDLIAHAHLPTIPNSQEEMFNGIMKSIKFPVPDEMLPRLRSLVISRLKDIRTADQVREYALKKFENGGLGLNERQVEELMQAINILTTKNTKVRNNKDSKIGKLGNEEIEGVTEVETPPSLFASAHKVSSPIRPGSTESPRSELMAKANRGGIEMFATETKPILQDVVAPKKVEETVETVGPIDELKMFTLTDFRRLAGKPEEAIKILQEKFIDLRAEAYTFYVKGKEAWHQSPLYQAYAEIIKTGIEKPERLDNVFQKLNKKNNLTKEEFLALVGMMERI